jgi:hypothetical protein
MSRMVRFASALLILASLTCASLGAVPPRFSSPPVEPAGSFLAAAVEWLASLLAPDRLAGTAPQRPQPKEGGVIDPSGGGGGGG